MAGPIHATRNLPPPSAFARQTKSTRKRDPPYDRAFTQFPDEGLVYKTSMRKSRLPPDVDPEQSLHNFRVAESFTLAFFDKYLKGDQDTILDTGNMPDLRTYELMLRGFRRTEF